MASLGLALRHNSSNFTGLISRFETRNTLRSGHLAVDSALVLAALAQENITVRILTGLQGRQRPPFSGARKQAVDGDVLVDVAHDRGTECDSSVAYDSKVARLPQLQQ